MNASQFAELYRNLAIIAEHETVLERVAKYVRKQVKQLTDDPACMTTPKQEQVIPNS